MMKVIYQQTLLTSSTSQYTLKSTDLSTESSVCVESERVILIFVDKNSYADSMLCYLTTVDSRLKEIWNFLLQECLL